MVKIGNRIVGDGAPCFITFEAGPTHNGVESAKRLIDYAAEAGANAIKFQIFDPDKLVADKSLPFTYKVLVDRETGETEEITESLHELLSRRCLTREEWHKIKKHSDNVGLAFFATVGDISDIEFLESLGCDSIKIASADINHFPLLRAAAKTKMCIQTDTGNATIGEIEAAVDIIIEEGNNNIIIHNCPTGYPARLDSINLNLLKTLKQIFNFPVAYSDHTPGAEMDIAAVALGANLVEKTITEDRTTRSVEHIMSLEPHEMMGFVNTIHEIETAMGRPRRVLFPEELKNRLNIRRSVYLAENVQKGQCLGDVKVEFRRPGYGIAPNDYEKLFQYQFVSNFSIGHQLSMIDLAFVE